MGAEAEHAVALADLDLEAQLAALGDLEQARRRGALGALAGARDVLDADLEADRRAAVGQVLGGEPRGGALHHRDHARRREDAGRERAADVGQQPVRDGEGLGALGEAHTTDDRASASASGAVSIGKWPASSSTEAHAEPLAGRAARVLGVHDGVVGAHERDAAGGRQPARVTLALRRGRLRPQPLVRPVRVLLAEVGEERAARDRLVRPVRAPFGVALRRHGEGHDRCGRLAELVAHALALERHERAQVDERAHRPPRRHVREDQPAQRVAHHDHVVLDQERGGGVGGGVEPGLHVVAREVDGDRAVAALAQRLDQPLPAPGAVPGAVEEGEGRHGAKYRARTGRAMSEWRAMPRTFALAILLALLVPSTAAAAFKAHGSARQVYVTGAKPGDEGDGRRQDEARGPARRDRLPRRQARHLHGARQAGARVLRPLGAAVEEELQAEAPQERLRLPDHARRDQARDQRAPPERARAVPDADRVRGLRLREPGRRAERHQPDRQPARLRGRRREHARHRLLGRLVRLLREAPEPRRLRHHRDRRAPVVGRAPQGRDDGRVLRRHQPAVRRPDAAPEPRRDHAAVGGRQHADHALSGRHPQHRLHARVGEGPRVRRASPPRRPAARRGR